MLKCAARPGPRCLNGSARLIVGVQKRMHASALFAAIDGNRPCCQRRPGRLIWVHCVVTHTQTDPRVRGVGARTAIVLSTGSKPPNLKMKGVHPALYRPEDGELIVDARCIDCTSVVSDNAHGLRRCSGEREREIGSDSCARGGTCRAGRARGSNRRAGGSPAFPFGWGRVGTAGRPRRSTRRPTRSWEMPMEQPDPCTCTPTRNDQAN